MKTVFFDVDTQVDFVFPAGALYVPGAEKIVNNLAALTRFAAANRFQIISDTDAHSEDDPEFKVWNPHCVAGTVGQQKIRSTLLNQPLVLSSAHGSLDALRSRIAEASQIIVEKQTLDCFTNPNLRPLLDLIAADRYIVYGVATEHCVRYAAFGLLETGARVEIVTDTISGISASDEREVLQRFQSQGGVLTTSAALIG
ncbi:MAG: cysteine hydrolase family protein [Bryobacteraceae bacterium]